MHCPAASYLVWPPKRYRLEVSYVYAYSSPDAMMYRRYSKYYVRPVRTRRELPKAGDKIELRKKPGFTAKVIGMFSPPDGGSPLIFASLEKDPGHFDCVERVMIGNLGFDWKRYSS